MNDEMMTMTFEQLAYFLTLAAEGTFVAAARRCGITQPSLTNAIKSLETTLGGELFERTATGSELTDFGRQMHPHLARLHHDRIRALEFARTFDRSADRTPGARPQPAPSKWRPGQSHESGKPNRRTVTLALAALLACMAIAAKSPTQAGDKNVEATIRDSLPAPVRCGRTSEPLFYCRHEDAARHTMVLELASGLDGPSASLTHDYDDAGRHQLFAVMRGFFIRLGVPADTFDDCVSQSQWEPEHPSGNGLKLRCHRVELGDRVTHEIFAMVASEAPLLAHAGEVTREE
jgi:hypothetical protein